MKHPLDETFNIESEYQDEDYVHVDIPNDPSLDTIISLALKAYKEQMEIIGLVEPKNRIKYIEVCEKLLGQAKDAMYKKEQLKISREKMAGTAKKKTQLLEEQTVEGEVVDRNKLYELRKVKG